MSLQYQKEFQSENGKDPQLSQVKQIMFAGSDCQQNLAKELHEFGNFYNEISMESGILLKN